jgi:hypothetical protein
VTVLTSDAHAADVSVVLALIMDEVAERLRVRAPALSDCLLPPQHVVRVRVCECGSN